MVKLIGNEKISCAVFISGRGTNLKSIFEYSKTKNSRINLKLVISNRSEALGINFAKNNIPVINIKPFTILLLNIDIIIIQNVINNGDIIDAYFNEDNKLVENEINSYNYYVDEIKN